MILWPRTWRFRFHPHKILTEYIDPPKAKPIEEIERNFAIYYGRYIDHNEAQLKPMFWAFRIGCLLLLVQVLAWILDVR